MLLDYEIEKQYRSRKKTTEWTCATWPSVHRCIATRPVYKLSGFLNRAPNASSYHRLNAIFIRHATTPPWENRIEKLYFFFSARVPVSVYPSTSYITFFCYFFSMLLDILFKEKKKKSIDPYMRSKIISLEEFIVTFFFFFFKSIYNNFYII